MACDVKDIQIRVSALRAYGFRVAIDDRGASYAGLSSFVALQPEEYDCVRVCGCDLLQGNLLAKPGPPFPRAEKPR